MSMTTKFAVGKYFCEMSWSPNGGLQCEWSPDVPAAKSFDRHLMSQYRAGRDAFIQEIADAIGGSVWVLEVGA